MKAEKRFLSTIARRLDTLGAITRGQRQTGGQGLFRPEDNLESPYARDALRQLYRRIYRGDVVGCSLGTFEDVTGLSLTDDNGKVTSYAYDKLNRLTTKAYDNTKTVAYVYDDQSNVTRITDQATRISETLASLEEALSRKRLVITGDPTQTDLPGNKRSGLIEAHDYFATGSGPGKSTKMDFVFLPPCVFGFSRVFSFLYCSARRFTDCSPVPIFLILSQ